MVILKTQHWVNCSNTTSIEHRHYYGKWGRSGWVVDVICIVRYGVRQLWEHQAIATEYKGYEHPKLNS